ncbi:MAG TPA: acetoacetate--CoA ligase [Mycobacteriales bacterium]|nr:acetoacetate--CoA ligase [Mycobacteriales bacterium]
MVEPMWVPDPDTAAGSQLARFAAFAGVPADYATLWEWSVDDLPGFWSAVREFFDLPFTGSRTTVLAGEEMPGARWFPDVRLNYVDQVFRAGRDGVAIVGAAEDSDAVELTWPELRRQVGALAATLRSLGVREGDRVVGFLPNVPEAVVAFLATASLGAVWSAVGQDYAAPAVLDRFAQLEPVVLIAADGYRFAGRPQDRREALAELRSCLPNVRSVIVVHRLGLPVDGAVPWSEAVAGTAELAPVPVAFDHPLWVLFSSGTTGLPKGIVHGHGGVLLEHTKTMGLHLDLGPRDRFFWFTSPSWMMWNYLVSGLLAGATIVTYDGSPTLADSDALWSLAARHEVSVLGVSPAYLQGSARAGREPAAEHDLSALRLLGVTGSVLPPASYDWVADRVGPRVQLVSTTGGTDVVTGFAGGAALVPVYRGEISARCLGVALYAWDADGKPVVGEVGELVITRPMPSMPVGFWGDPDGTRYRDAYFDTYPGVWRHGDWVTVTERGGVVVHGRSDSTLNRHGIRMGSADIYAVVERRDDVVEALVIGAEMPDGSYWMPLFVVLAEGRVLDDALAREIKAQIRAEASPRHVPDEVLQIPAVPHTRTGKKLEVPVKRLLQGAPLEQVVNPGSVDDPGLFDYFTSLWTSRRADPRP